VSPGHSSAAQGEAEGARSGAEAPAFIEDTVALRGSAEREAERERQQRLGVVSAARRPRLPGRALAAAALGAAAAGCVVALVLNQGSAAPSPRATLAQRPALPHSRPAPSERDIRARQIRPRRKASHGGGHRASLRRGPGRRPRATVADRKAPSRGAPVPPPPATPISAPAAVAEPPPVTPQPTSTPPPPQHPAASPTPVSKEFGFER
jgi:hypothetical protein